MIDDQPTPLTLTVSKAEPRRERHWLALAYIGKGVIAGVDCNVSVDPDTVLPQLDLQVGAGRPGHEVFPNRGRAIAQRRGYGAPKHGLGAVEGQDWVQGLAVDRVGPPRGGGGDLPFRPRPPGPHPPGPPAQPRH